VTDPTTAELRDYVLRVIGSLSAIELGVPGTGDMLSGPMTPQHFHRLVNALTLLCREFATEVAQTEGSNRMGIYRRMAERYA
jgi:hypothetical protein